MDITLAAALGILGIIATYIGLSVTLGKRQDEKIKAATDHIKELHATEMKGVGRTLDNHSSEIAELREGLEENFQALNKNNIVLEHVIQTMDRLGNVVEKLDNTVSALQLTIVRMESVKKD